MFTAITAIMMAAGMLLTPTSGADVDVAGAVAREPHRSIATALHDDLGHSTTVRGNKTNGGASVDAMRTKNDKENSVCTIGFIARKGDRRYAVTAGHCFNDGKLVKGVKPVQVVNNTPQGYRAVKQDYAVIRVNGTPKTAVSLGAEPEDGPHITIDRIGTPKVGMRVCSYGDTSGWRCGVVTTLHGDHGFRTTLESRPGDSGGIVINGDGELMGIVVTGSTTPEGYSRGGDSDNYNGGSGVTRADWIMEDAGLDY